MSAAARPGRSRQRTRAATPRLVELDRHRIEQALTSRSRYRYVQPRVEREGEDWKIVSPNCSRQVDPEGGPIDIAWLEPARDGTATWHLHSRHHGSGRWLCQAEGLTLAQALERVCSDPLGTYWP